MRPTWSGRYLVSWSFTVYARRGKKSHIRRVFQLKLLGTSTFDLSLCKTRRFRDAKHNTNHSRIDASARITKRLMISRDLLTFTIISFLRFLHQPFWTPPVTYDNTNHPPSRADCTRLPPTSRRPTELARRTTFASRSRFRSTS